METAHLKLPQINKQIYRRCYAGLRPFRKNGIRLEKQIIGNKTIFHNYGHGGAGVCLSPATAFQVGQLVEKENISDKKVGILGAGIVGIATALELAQKGYEITIYSDKFPDKNKTENKTLNTSEIAPGYWLPYYYHFKHDRKLHEKRSLKAYHLYREWMKKYKGIYECQVYEDLKIEEFNDMAPKFLKYFSKQVKVSFSKNSNKFKTMIYFKTIKINLRQLLHELMSRCKQLGIKFENYELTSIEDVHKIKQSYLVNSLGFGSKKIFGDENVYGTKGHLLEFSNPLKIKEYLCFKYNGGLKFYCFDDKVLVGITSEQVENQEINPKMVERIFNNAINFTQEYGDEPKPKL